MADTKTFRFETDRLIAPGTIFEADEMDTVSRWVVTRVAPDPEAVWKFHDFESDPAGDAEAWPKTMLVTAKVIR